MMIDLFDFHARITITMSMVYEVSCSHEHEMIEHHKISDSSTRWHQAAKFEARRYLS